MSKLSFRARALDASKPMPIYLAEELPDLPDYSAINRAVPQMPSGMEKEEECEHHLQRAICTGLIIPTPEVCQVSDLEFYERCYPPDYKMPKQHIHMQPLWQEQEAPEYDIDSEDERWLKQQRHPELTELKFEEMMDKLEKSSGQTVVTLSEAKLLLERHDDLIIAVYDYWLNKRLNTQHPLILSVKTESRPGQSTNNPYLAFRRRTEKMQTRKNRKNDESSYEKMLKLRRDLARALTLLELVGRRERAKRELVKLTALIAERRYNAGDFANQLLPEPPPRPTFTAVPLITPTATRRETYTTHYVQPRAVLTPVDNTRSREKRPYKKRKHRHHGVGTTHQLRDSGVYTSSEEESSPRSVETTTDDGPFAFTRKPGCHYEMPTSTLYGDTVDNDNSNKDRLYDHEIDPRHRFTLTSLNEPYPHCVGFARRRMGRGGRVIIDRIQTPLDDLWRRLDFKFPKSSAVRAERDEEVDLETNGHRNPKVLTRDYHTSGKYPWRHTFRQHLRRNPELWTCALKDETDIKLTPEDIKMAAEDVKLAVQDIDIATDFDEDVKMNVDDIKVEPMDVDTVLPQDSDISVSVPRTIDSVIKDNLDSVIRKRTWSDCSDSSYDSDEKLYPVEKEFEKFIDEVNKKWLHFRPKTPPKSPPLIEQSTDDYVQIEMETPFTVEMANALPSSELDVFTTSEFSLKDLYGDVLSAQELDNSGSSLDISGEDLLNENLGLTEAQVESILSETDLKALTEADDKKPLPDDLLEELVKNVDEKDSFLSNGQGLEGRTSSGLKRKKADSFGSTVLNMSVDKQPIYMECTPKVTKIKIEKPKITPLRIETPKQPIKEEKIIKEVIKDIPVSVPTSKIIVEEVNEVPQIKVERRRKEDTIEEIQLGQGVQLKTVQTKHSPLKKHIITSGAHRRVSDVTLVTSQESAQPQIVTVAVTDSLKVRLQNHVLSTSSGVTTVGGTVLGVVQNGPFQRQQHHGHHQQVVGVSGIQTVTASVAAAARRATGVTGVTAGGTGVTAGVTGVTAGMATVPLHHKHLQLHHAPNVTHTPLVVASHPHNKLKVLHAHPLTQSQRTQLLAQSRASGITQIPAVVSLATLGDVKTTNTALLKAAPGSVAQFFEIKGGQLAKGPHLVNVVRQPAPGKTTVARLDFNDAKKRQVVAFDGTLKGNIATATRPHRVSVSLDGRQIVRAAALPQVRAPVRHQIQLKNRTLVTAPQIARSVADPTSSITIATPTKAIPSSIVANLLQKNVQLPKSGQKISISSATGQLSANVQAIAFTTAQLKARQARLIAQPRATPVAEIVEATTAPVATSSSSGDAPMDGAEGDDATTNGAVRRRQADTMPMEVT